MQTTDAGKVGDSPDTTAGKNFIKTQRLKLRPHPGRGMACAQCHVSLVVLDHVLLQLGIGIDPLLQARNKPAGFSTINPVAKFGVNQPVQGGEWFSGYQRRHPDHHGAAVCVSDRYSFQAARLPAQQSRNVAPDLWCNFQCLSCYLHGPMRFPVIMVRHRLQYTASVP
jgi:hypothetical protein